MLHVISGLGSGGAERALLGLCQALTPLGYDSDVVNLGRDGLLQQAFDQAAVPVTELGITNALAAPGAVVALSRRIRAERYAVVQTWLPHADVLGGIAAILASRAALVWSIHRAEVELDSVHRYTKWAFKLGRWLAPVLPHRIVCCAEASAAFLEAEGYPADRLSVIPNGFDTHRFRPDAEAGRAFRCAHGIGADELLVGHAGRLHAHKDYPTMFAAIARVQARHQHCRFVLAGTGLAGDNEQVSALRRALPRPEEVALLGFQADVAPMLQACDLVMLSSETEALPTMVGEGMACGCPAVATDVGDTRALVGATGWLAPAHEAEALAQSLLAALRLPRTERAALGERARERIVAHYGVDVMARRYADCYQELRRRRTRSLGKLS